MHELDQLLQQHVREYESRLKHLDELMDRAHQAAGEGNQPLELARELSVFKQERDRLSDHLKALRSNASEDWRTKQIERAGPMGIWDAVAQQLEKLVERLEHSDRRSTP